MEDFHGEAQWDHQKASSTLGSHMQTNRAAAWTERDLMLRDMSEQGKRSFLE